MTYLNDLPDRPIEHRQKDANCFLYLLIQRYSLSPAIGRCFAGKPQALVGIEPQICRGLAPTGRTSALDQIPHRSERRPAAMLSRQSRFRSWLKPYFATTHVPRNANSATTTADGTVALSPETL